MLAGVQRGEYHALKNRVALAALYAPLSSLPVLVARFVALTALAKAAGVRSPRLLARLWLWAATSLPGYVLKRRFERKIRRPARWRDGCRCASARRDV